MKVSVGSVVYGGVLVAYLAAFVAVLWIGTGLGKSAPVTVPVAALPAAAEDGPDVALAASTPTLVAALTAPTVTPRAPTATPQATIAATTVATANPNVDFHVPLSSSNTGTLLGHRVAIMNITDDARFSNALSRPSSGMKYIAVDVRVENTGAAPINLGTWRLHTDAGGDVTAATVRGLDSSLAAIATIGPNQALTGTVVFVVPASTTMTWIEYQPSATAIGRLYFDAR